MEDANTLVKKAGQQMEKAYEFVAGELKKIRAGKASPSMVEGIEVEAYGSTMPLNQVSSITSPDARTIAIKPFDKTMVGDIEKAIQTSDLGINPQNDGEIVRLNVPPLTEERRRDIVKQVKTEVEAGKVSIRNIRKDINDSLKKLQKEGTSEDEVKRSEEQVQKTTDQYNKKLDDLYTSKEKEIMTL